MSDWNAFPTAAAPTGDAWAEFSPAAPEADEWRQGTVLPIKRNLKTGDIDLDMTAGIPGAMWKGLTLPADVLTGKVQMRDADGNITDEVIGRSLEMAGMGSTGPAARSATLSVADAAKAYLARPDNALTGISKRAVEYARKTFDDPAKQAEFIRELQRLGPEATLADVSPEWMGVARGAASRPGQRDTVVKPLLERDAARNQRLAADVDAALGPAPVPSRVEADLAANREALVPRYGEVMADARAVDTQPLADNLDTMAVDYRGPGQRAAREVRGMLDIPGNPGNLDPNPNALLQTRQAIDGIMQTEQNPQAQRVLTAARRMIDEDLATAAPGVKDVDAQYSELMRQSEGLQEGGRILDSGKTAIRPQELAETLPAAAQPQGTMVGPSGVPVRMRQGARAEIDRVAGTNSNDPAALLRLVKGEGDWNRDKLRLLFGKERADAALDAIDREAIFYRTTGRVTSGSDTAMAGRFGDFLDETAKPNSVPTDTTMTGAALRGGQKAVQSVLRTNSEGNADRFAEALGRLSVARGADRDAIVRSLQMAVEARKAQGLPTAALENALRVVAPAVAVNEAER